MDQQATVPISGASPPADQLEAGKVPFDSPNASASDVDKDGVEGVDHKGASGPLARVWSVLSEKVSLEGHGVSPLSVEERTDPNFGQNFTLWLTMNATIACFSTGTLGPLLYGLSLRDSFLVIFFFNMFSCSIPSYFAIFGPRLGMRTMTVARYSYGYFGASLPALFNLITFIGFCAVNSIVGGQTLSAIAPDTLSINVGIVIIAVVSMLVSFCGYKVLHHLERWAWIPIIFSFIMLTAFGGRHLSASMDFPASDATPGLVLSFASIIVGFSISWCGCSADFNTYMLSETPSTTIFFYTLAGLYLPSMIFQVLGAAFAAAALSGSVTTWGDALGNGSVGALVGVALEPLGGFGKFLLVIIALGMITNNAPTTYAFSLSLQIVLPFLAKFPRFIFPIVATAIYVPIAIVGAQNFPAALNNFLGILGYWSAIFAAVFLVEFLVYRKGRYDAYKVEDWNVVRNLPPGYAALFSSFCGGVLVVMSMDQVWYRGPIAIAIAGPDAEFGGDVGFELGMLVAGLVYLPTRYLEKRIFGR